MIAFYLLPVFLGLGVYGYIRLHRWLAACTPLFRKKVHRIWLAALYLFCILDMYIAFFMKPSKLERSLKQFGNYWYGFLLYSMMIVFGADVLRWVCKRFKLDQKPRFHSRRTHVVHGILIVIAIFATCIYGVVHARQIYTTVYEVSIDKDGGDLNEVNIVLLADLHMGYNIGCDHIQKMVDEVNAQKPDVILIAGDIFDNSYDALEDPQKLIEILKTMQTKYGVYVVYGNHDIQERIIGGFTFGGKKNKQADERMDQFVEACGWTNLRDEAVLVADSFYIYGRPDYERPGKGIEKRKSADELVATLDDSKPIIVMEHEPVELDALAKAGVDLDLCGHTHDGQLFPLNITCDMIWENACGLLKKGNMTNIVTSGVGLYGPFMRVGTDAEICKIHVTFK